MPLPSEFDIQRALCIWLDGDPHPQTGVPRKTPALAPGVVYWHTPNGGNREGFEAKRLRQSGVKSGLHDLLFLRPTNFGAMGTWGLLFGMEMKKPGGSLSPAQKIMHPRLMRAGMAASIVVDDLQTAKDFCRLHMLTINKEVDSFQLMNRE